MTTPAGVTVATFLSVESQETAGLDAFLGSITASKRNEPPVLRVISSSESEMPVTGMRRGLSSPSETVIFTSPP